METNYTLKNLIRGGTLLLFFLAFMLTGPQSAQAQTEEGEKVTKEITLIVESPQYPELIRAFINFPNYVPYGGPDTHTLTVGATQLVRFNIEQVLVEVGIASEVFFYGWEDKSSYVVPGPGTSGYDWQYTMPGNDVTMKAIFKPQPYLLTADLDDVDHGTVSITEPGDGQGPLAGTVTETVGFGEAFEVVAVATPGYTFEKFVITDSDGVTTDLDKPEYGVGTKTGTLNSSIDNVNARMLVGGVTVTAHFTQHELTVGVNNEDGGDFLIDVDYLGVAGLKTNTFGPEVVVGGTGVKITAVASPTWTFTGWGFDPEEPVGLTSTTTNFNAGDEITFNMPGNSVTVTANFEAYTLVTDADDAGGGTVTTTIDNEVFNDGFVRAGDPVEIVAAASDTWTFMGWDLESDIGTLTNVSQLPKYNLYEDNGFAGQIITFEMPVGSVTVTAKFDRFEFTMAKVGTGTVTPTVGSEFRRADEQFALEQSAGENYRFDGWTVTPGTHSLSLTTNNGDQFTMPTGNVTVTATFNKLYLLTATIDPANVSDGVKVSLTDDPPAGDFAKTVTGTFVEDDKVYIVAATDAGQVSPTYVFKNWTSDPPGAEFGNASSTSTYVLMPAHAVTITANYVGGVTLTLAVDGDGLENDKFKVNDDSNVAPDTYGYAYYEGQQVVVEAPANVETGWTFVGWKSASVTVDGFDDANPELGVITFTMQATPGTVTAVFKQFAVAGLLSPTTVDKDQVKVQVNGNNAPQNITAGKTVTLTFTDNDPAYRFKDWTVTSTVTIDNLVGTNTDTASFTMPAGNVTATANFEPLNKLIVLDPGDGGDISGDINSSPSLDYNKPYYYEENAEIVLTAEATGEYTFVEWDIQVEGATVVSSTFKDYSGGVATITWHDSIGGVVTATAVIKQFTYTVLTQDENKVEVEPAGVNDLRAGRVGTFTATAINGWTFESLTVEGEPLGITSGTFITQVPVGVYTFTMPAGNVTITANWAEYKLTTAIFDDPAEEKGTITPNTRRQTAGKEMLVTATAEPGWTFVDFELDVTTSGFTYSDLKITNKGTKVGTATFTMPPQNITVRAVFEQYDLVVDIDVDHGDYSGISVDVIYGYEGGYVIGNVASSTTSVIPEEFQVTLGEDIWFKANDESSGYRFIEWTKSIDMPDIAPGGVTTNPYTFTMKKGMVVTATFNKLFKLTAVIDPADAKGTAEIFDEDGVEVTTDLHFISGEKAIVVAKGKEGWTFEKFVVYPVGSNSSTLTESHDDVEWSDADGGVATLTYTMPAADVHVVAHFVQHKLVLLTNPDDKGKIESDPHPDDITSGDEVVITADPEDDNWVFTGFTEEPADVGDWDSSDNFEPTGTATFTMPAATVTVTANFEEKNKIVYKSTAGGSFVGIDDGDVVHYEPGDDAGLVAQATGDFVFVGFKVEKSQTTELALQNEVGIQGPTGTATFTFGNLDTGGVATITAQFSLQADFITKVSPAGAGTIKVDVLDYAFDPGQEPEPKGGLPYPVGSLVRLEATTPNPEDWIFDTWEFEPYLEDVFIHSGTLTSNVIEIIIPLFSDPDQKLTATAKFRVFQNLIITGPDGVCISENGKSAKRRYTITSDNLDVFDPTAVYDEIIWDYTSDDFVESVVGVVSTGYITNQKVDVVWKIATVNIPGTSGGSQGGWLRARGVIDGDPQPRPSAYFPVDLFVSIDEIDGGVTDEDGETLVTACPGEPVRFVVGDIKPAGAAAGVNTSTWTKVQPVGKISFTAINGIGNEYDVSIDTPGIYNLEYTVWNGTCSYTVKGIKFIVKDIIDEVSIDGISSNDQICFSEVVEVEALPVFTDDGQTATEVKSYKWKVYEQDDESEIVFDETFLVEDEEDAHKFAIDFMDWPIEPTGVDTPTVFIIEVEVKDECDETAIFTTTFTVNPIPVFTIHGVKDEYCYINDDFTVSLTELANLGDDDLGYPGTSPVTPTFEFKIETDADLGSITSTYDFGGSDFAHYTGELVDFGPLPSGSYTLTVTVNNGYCEVVDHKVFAVYSKIVQAFLEVEESEICFGCEVDFAATYTTTLIGAEASVEYMWEVTVDTATPVYTMYYDEGPPTLNFNAPYFADYFFNGETITTTLNYTVEVSIKDNCGTIRTASETLSVHPEPKVLFTVNDKVASTGSEFEFCYDETVVVKLHEFVSEITEIATLTWEVTYAGTASPTPDLSGTVTNVSAPFELFADKLEPGEYEVKVTQLITDKGCVPVDVNIYKLTIIIHEEPAVIFAVDTHGPFGSGDAIEVCNPVKITLDEIVSGSGPIQTMTWTVYDEDNNVVTDVLSYATDVDEKDTIFNDHMPAGTYIVKLNELIDANGCEPSDYGIYTFTLTVRPLPVATIDGLPIDNEICHNGVVELSLLYSEYDFGSTYTITWTVNGDEFVTDEFVLDTEDYGTITETTFVDVSVHIVNEWGCEYPIGLETIRINGRPEVTRNRIIINGDNVWCATIPAGEKIVGDGVVLFTTGNPAIDIEDVVVLYRWQYSVDGPDGPWFSYGDTFEPGDRDLILENITETTWFRRQVKLNGDLCDLYPNPRHTSNVVKMKVIEDPDHFDLDPIAAGDDVCLGGEITLETNLPEFTTGTWTYEGPDGGELEFVVGDVNTPGVTVKADKAGEYTVRWTILHGDEDNTVNEGCPGDGDFVEKTIIFEELELVPLVFNGAKFCADDDTPVEIDLDVVVSLEPAGAYTPIMYINNVAQADLEFVPSALGVGTHTITLWVETAIGCEDYVEAVVTVNALPEPLFAIDGDIISGNHVGYYCSGTEIDVTFAGFNPDAGELPLTVTYTITAPDGSIEIESEVITAEGQLLGTLTLEAGTYEIVLTDIVDGNGCTVANIDLYTITLNVDEAPIPLFAINGVPIGGNHVEDPLCEGSDVTVAFLGLYEDTGELPITISYEVTLDGVLQPDLGDSDVELDGPQDLFDRDDLAPGVYVISVTEIYNNFCAVANPADFYNATITIIATPPAPVVNDVVVYHDGTDKEFDVTADPDFTLEWKDNGDWTDDPLPTFDEVGVYTITVRHVGIDFDCDGEEVVASLTILNNIVLGDVDEDMFRTAETLFFQWDIEDYDGDFEVRLTADSKDANDWIPVVDATSISFPTAEVDVDPATTYLFEVRTVNSDKDDTVGFASATITTLAKGNVNAVIDADGNDVINVIDVQLLVAYITDKLGDRVVIDDADELVGLESDVFIFDAADMNNDNVIDIFDIVRIVNAFTNGKEGSYDSESANIFLSPDQIRLESDGSLTALQLVLTGDNLDEVKLAMSIPGFQVAWSTQDDVLTAIVFSLGNQLIEGGKTMLIDITNGENLKWGEVFASNSFAERVPVLTHYDTPTDIVDDFASLLSLDVYPNPSSGEFTSRIDLPVKSNVTLQLFDINGRQIAVKQVEANAGVEEVSWSLDLNPGMYVLRMVATPEGLNKQGITREVRIMIN